MRFFVTGHTGFKGSWLTALLKEKGHEVFGYSIDCDPQGLFLRAGMEQDLSLHVVGDVRDYSKLRDALLETNPDVVIHLAAQALVLRSYAEPLETFTTNVNGTLNLLKALDELPSTPVTLIVTTDKVYKDTGKTAYAEDDPLGGNDPYSASKAMADILVQSWASANPELPIYIARAGNVIGPFDSAKDRLLPDIARALTLGQPLKLRNSKAIRPWQHVLDCLEGYLSFVEGALRQESLPVALNFGPSSDSLRTVDDVLTVAHSLNLNLKTEKVTDSPPLRETKVLALNSGLARKLLGWDNKLGFEDSVKNTLMHGTDDARSTVFSTTKNFIEGKLGT